MPEPLTGADLTAALNTHTEVIKRNLNDRFDHYEKQQDAHHREMMQGFAQVIENVNEHTTIELQKLHDDLDIRQQFNHLTATLARRFGVSVHDLTGR